ncbi:hypothetical protein SYJ56_01960 [Algoriphagus sp. D3-2-R+10]|uniref:hypothetical protein n=1 Tax=Algoriphagus aurantiacus TaxID=3103948 RepID=UPI002B3DCB55|nr:hypothetical protein [Algoriphagus sp. D3-2-R+10]MEB2774050.1 hypothetical protein [Algoriphagus sp. D3-2-R+10]
MKYIIIVLALLLPFAGCSDVGAPQGVDSVQGTWQLIETYGSDGGAGNWMSIENGYTYTFEEDNILLSNRFSCNGTYVETADSLTIDFNCTDVQFQLVYGVSYEENRLVLTPDPANCDEGCAEKFKRVQ